MLGGKIGGNGAGTWRRSLRAALDLLAFASLSSLGWRISVPAFKALVVWLAVAAIPVIAAVSHLAASTFAQRVEAFASPDAAAVTMLLFMGIVNVYMGAGLLARETFSRRRLRVSGSPHEDLYRALDIDKLAVFAVFVGLRTVALFAALALVNLSVVTVVVDHLAAPGMGWLLAVLLPVAMALGHLSLACRFALHPPRAARVGLAVFVGLVVGSAVSGAALALLVVELVRQVGRADRLPTSSPAWAGEGSLMLAMVAAAVGAALALSFLARGVGALARECFARRPAQRPTTGSTHHSVQLATARQPVMLLLHREVTRSGAAVVLRRMVLVVALLLAFVAGFGSRFSPVVGETVSDSVVRASLLLSFLVCLAFVELVMGPAGIAPLIRHLRYLWESGLSLRTISAGAIGYYIAGATAFALLLSLLPLVAVGRWSPFHLILGLSIPSAAALGQAITASSRDHGVELGDPSLVVALMTILLSAPVLGALLLRGGPSLFLAVIYTLILVGGAHSCLQRRIIAMPLSSKP